MNTPARILLGTPVMTAVAYGEAVAVFQHVRTMTVPFEAVLTRLRQAIAAAGLWVLHEIDPQKVLQSDGHAIDPARQILFFHPDLMVRLLQPIRRRCWRRR